jgi:hypothetical protein
VRVKDLRDIRQLRRRGDEPQKLTRLGAPEGDDARGGKSPIQDKRQVTQPRRRLGACSRSKPNALSLPWLNRNHYPVNIELDHVALDECSPVTAGERPSLDDSTARCELCFSDRSLADCPSRTRANLPVERKRPGPENGSFRDKRTERCPSGLRSATGNRVCAERCIEGSNPSLSAPAKARHERAFARQGLRYDAPAWRSGRVAEGGALLRR